MPELERQVAGLRMELEIGGLARAGLEGDLVRIAARGLHEQRPDRGFPRIDRLVAGPLAEQLRLLRLGQNFQLVHRLFRMSGDVFKQALEVP